MSDRLERILALLDGTGQDSWETGYGVDLDGSCARCLHNAAAEGAEFCAGCRAFLLGDRDADPRYPQRRQVVHGYSVEVRPVEMPDLPQIAAPRGGVAIHHVNGDRRDNRDVVRNIEVDFCPGHGEIMAAMDRLCEGLEVDADRLARLAEAVAELARAAWVPLVEACQAIIDTLTEPAVQAAIESITASLDAELRRPTLVDARGRELALLAERRREQRRTNRWGQPPGGRR